MNKKITINPELFTVKKQKSKPTKPTKEKTNIHKHLLKEINKHKNQHLKKEYPRHQHRSFLSEHHLGIYIYHAQTYVR